MNPLPNPFKYFLKKVWCLYLRSTLPEEILTLLCDKSQYAVSRLAY